MLRVRVYYSEGLMQLRELVRGLKSLQVTQTDGQKGKLDVDESKENGGGKTLVLSPGRDQVWPGEMPGVHSVVRRSFALNCVTLGSPLTTLSLSFLCESLGVPPPHRTMAQSDTTRCPYLHLQLPPPCLRASLAGAIAKSFY